ncbi:alpha/beta hydrolase [Amycolatopsis umgeniensis]|uniref:Pimeloyl-ACP methyl ester carboxylesterase n=1 Tax=Amycolatopsis umgeniensis TaxID=336628 RepID=A0A841BBJ9_9PSEU|nr:pimeloyl-ACP methyl ester carboxylesterase [Amycolatopsis umgeniensis]
MTTIRVRTAALITLTALATVTIAPVVSATPKGIDWGPCPAGSPPGYDCAELQVPLSYQDPGGPRITIALGRLPATDRKHKRGTLFTNPGGPGNPGRFSEFQTESLHRQFDIVGFDPRGVGASTPVRCFASEAETEPLKRVLGQFPITVEQETRHLADVREVAASCGRNAGPLLGHLSTTNVARDLDKLRQAAGEPHLRYYGLSYGTYLGEVYANLFPQRVGALALDAVDDPVAWSTGHRPDDANVPFSTRLGGFRDADRALQAFLDTCAADVRCAFREPGTDLRAKYDGILDRLEATPGALTYQEVIRRTHNALTDEANSPALAEFLQAATKSVTSKAIVTPFDSALGGGGTICADTTNPRDPAAWAKAAREADREGRGFGSYDTYLSLPCAFWPASDPARHTGPWNRPTAPILLLANGKGDPETPYAGAKRTERILGNARLLTLDAWGHGAANRSKCVDAALDAYLTYGRLPARGTVCAPDQKPFDPR